MKLNVTLELVLLYYEEANLFWRSIIIFNPAFLFDEMFFSKHAGMLCRPIIFYTVLEKETKNKTL